MDLALGVGSLFMSMAVVVVLVAYHNTSLHYPHLYLSSTNKYSFQIELNFIAWIKGYKITEIPIVFTDRTVGESKMNGGIVIEAIWMVPKLLIKKIFKLY